jgi:putative membrane protein
MKKLSLFALIAVSACTIQACNNGAKDTKASADSANAAKIDSTKADTGSKMAPVAGTTPVDKDDAKFAVEAANGGMAEVSMGKIAQQNATNDRVKNFGAMMVSDHTKANNEMMGLAKTKNITLPATENNDEQKMEADLSKKTGKDFDKAYVNGMVKDHKDDVKKFEDAAKNLKDPDLKAFAAKTLPVLKMHLDSIQAIKKALNY